MNMASLLPHSAQRVVSIACDPRSIGASGLRRCVTRARPPQSPHPSDKEFEVNFGRAIDCLREDLPAVFQRRPTASIYQQNLIFESPMLQLTTLSAYLWALACMRVAVRVLFRGAAVWAMLRRLFVRTPTGKPPPVYTPPYQLDLLFTYGFSPKGLVDLHRIETVVPLEPPAAQVEVEKALATALSRARPEGVVIATGTQDSDMVVGLLDLKQQQS